MNNNLTASLLDFLDKSPTPYHAVNNMAARLDDEGFVQLPERESWSLQVETRYYVIRGGSSIVAFVTAQQEPEEVGVRIVGAHTDSPCLKVKPQPEIVNNGYLQLGVEVYGGALLNPWFDRDLSIAGRVTYLDTANEIYSTLLDYREPIAVIPSLAIHLDQEVNKKKTVNPQQHLPVILSTHDSEGKPDIRDMLLSKLKQDQPEAKAQSILDFDLCLYDSQIPQVVGFNHEFLASARLDNLVSCFTGLYALLDSRSTLPAMLVCNDHEEVGSRSAIGAQGTFLRSVLERWCDSAESYQRAVNRSMLISADNSHGVHPNFADKHDQNHGPLLNKGPVIKINHNQRYATNSVTSAIYRQLCDQHDIPLQVFVSRTDLACGSTIGPLTASEVGVQTLDVGIPQFAMHSIRELCGVHDVDYFYRSLLGFYGSEILL